MGAREGTRPDDDPLTRSLTASAREEGRSEGLAEGRASGCGAGRRAERADAVCALLLARGIEPAAGFADEPALLAEAPLETLMAAALACADEADFRRRLREQAAWPPP